MFYTVSCLWLLDDGIPRHEDALPPEVTDDDQQLFSLAAQVCESHTCINSIVAVEKAKFLLFTRSDSKLFCSIHIVVYHHMPESLILPFHKY